MNSFSFLPNLFCLKKTGPLESSLIINAISNKNGDKTTIAKKENIISNTLLKNK
jgi:hypothetical protein